MQDATLLSDLIALSASRLPELQALSFGDRELTYAELHVAVEQFASGLMDAGVRRGARIAIYMEQRPETVVACFGAAAAGCAFVPVNPLLKPDQVAFILRDCNVCVLVTTHQRLELISNAISTCTDLRQVVAVGSGADILVPSAQVVPWSEFMASLLRPGHRVIDVDMAAIFYTSGSTGSPKGVVLSHRNLVAGAKSVASYLGNQPSDRLLAALPLSFDAGFSQLTTAFHSGASVALLNYLLPRDVLLALEQKKITGITAVPPLYIQLARLDWPHGAGQHLRYFANTGGHMPGATLSALRRKLPEAKPFLMYGLTESFRSTFLPPEEVDRRPNSIGKAIPGAEVVVLREDGTECAADEPGELVHRGALVSLGYWNDPARTAERYRWLPSTLAGREAGLPLSEIAVYSGDIVRRDSEGYLYFVGRRDDLIKTSGYRVSPTEVEDAVYATGLVTECVAFGLPDDDLGQAIKMVAVVVEKTGASGQNDLKIQCRRRMPAYMVPKFFEFIKGPMPRNQNGKIDRKKIIDDLNGKP